MRIYVHLFQEEPAKQIPSRIHKLRVAWGLENPRVQNFRSTASTSNQKVKRKPNQKQKDGQRISSNTIFTKIKLGLSQINGQFPLAHPKRNQNGNRPFFVSRVSVVSGFQESQGFASAMASDSEGEKTAPIPTVPCWEPRLRTLVN